MRPSEAKAFVLSSVTLYRPHRALTQRELDARRSGQQTRLRHRPARFNASYLFSRQNEARKGLPGGPHHKLRLQAGTSQRREG
jgi:hypothetical protein